MIKKAYLITSIEEFGKFIAFCIENDISVWRTYWDEREKGDRLYQIDWENKRCLYCSKRYYKEEGFEIIQPEFYVSEFGCYKMKK